MTRRERLTRRREMGHDGARASSHWLDEKGDGPSSAPWCFRPHQRPRRRARFVDLVFLCCCFEATRAWHHEAACRGKLFHGKGRPEFRGEATSLPSPVVLCEDSAVFRALVCELADRCRPLRCGKHQSLYRRHSLLCRPAIMLSTRPGSETQLSRAVERTGVAAGRLAPAASLSSTRPARSTAGSFGARGRPLGRVPWVRAHHHLPVFTNARAPSFTGSPLPALAPAPNESALGSRARAARHMRTAAPYSCRVPPCHGLWPVWQACHRRPTVTSSSSCAPSGGPGWPAASRSGRPGLSRWRALRWGSARPGWVLCLAGGSRPQSVYPRVPYQT